MKKCKNLVVLFFVLLGYIVIGQETKKYPKIDSIKIRMSKQLDISLKGHQLLCNYYELLHHTDSAYSAINKYVSLAKIEKDDEHLAKAASIKGVYFGKLAQLDSAIFYLKKAASLSKAQVNVRQEALNNISITYRMGKKTDSALIYMVKAINLAKKENYKPGILNAYIGLSDIYDQKGAYITRIAYLDSALITIKNSKKVNYRKTATLLHSLGNINAELDNIQKAKKYYLQAIDTCNYHNDNFILFYVNNSLASQYILENKLDSAYIYLNNNLKHPSFDKNKDLLAKTNRRLYEIEYKNKNYVKAISYNDVSLKNASPKSRELNIANYQRAQVLTAQKKYLKALEYLSLITAKDIKDLTLKKDFYQTTFEVNLALNNKEKSTYNLKRFLEIRDSLFSEEKVSIAQSLDVKYQTQQKENQILALENEAQKKEIKLEKSKTKTNYAVGSVFFFFLAGGLYLRKRKKDQQVNLLEAAINSGEQEKIRIGKELHDGIAGNLMSLVHQTETNDVELSHKLLSSYNEIRNVSHQLNNTSIHGEIFLDRIQDIIPINKENQLFDFTLTPHSLELNEPYSTHIYRIAQELFTNNLKHAKAAKTSLDITYKENVLHIAYKDNGPGTAQLKKGAGLTSIEERLILLNGELDIEATNGFNITIKIPYKA